MFRELYIHVPFCLKKCDYCAFYSIENSTAALRERWLDRIIFDLELHRDRLQDLQSVYFGGGTPTLPDTDFLERMFHRILRSGIIGLQRNAEITSEANPETINGEKAALLTRYVNRISMGVQSFHPEKRAVLGRRPASAEHVFTAVEHLRKNGLANLGFDLMYAVPGETLEDWTADLRQAAVLAPEHLSAYALTPEERTPYADRHGLKPPDDELSSAMWHRAGEILQEQGLTRYEISNYAKPGFEAKHNCHVWQGQTYLGLGPSATSFDGTDRWTEPADLNAWIERTEAPETDRIPREKRLREMLIMGLRQVNGWTRSQFRRAVNSDEEADWMRLAGPELLSLQRTGLLTVNEELCRPTETGLEFWNEIAEQLI